MWGVFPEVGKSESSPAFGGQEAGIDDEWALVTRCVFPLCLPIQRGKLAAVFLNQVSSQRDKAGARPANSLVRLCSQQDHEIEFGLHSCQGDSRKESR